MHNTFITLIIRNTSINYSSAKIIPKIAAKKNAKKFEVEFIDNSFAPTSNPKILDNPGPIIVNSPLSIIPIQINIIVKIVKLLAEPIIDPKV